MTTETTRTPTTTRPYVVTELVTYRIHVPEGEDPEEFFCNLNETEFANAFASVEEREIVPV